MPAKRTMQETTENVVDMTTGEVVSKSNKKVSVVQREPDYVKLYLDDLCALVELPDALKNTLNMMLRKLDYDGYITLSPRFRKTMCERLGVKDQTLRNRINQLCKKQMLFRDGTNEYLVNPNYFARGEWRHIIEQRKTFEMKISYSADGERKITTTAEDQPERADEQQPDLFEKS